VVGQIPRNRGRGVTVIASLRLAGLGPSMTLDGGTGHDDFARYLDEVLLPTLAPGTTIIMDNLSAHRPRAVCERITAAGCTLHYLPAYSPDFNPIELGFGLMKAGLRQREIRDRADVPAAMLEELARITPEMAANWFRHCGYTPQAQ
jgi:transposase